jgi:hypothetical protein
VLSQSNAQEPITTHCKTAARRNLRLVHNISVVWGNKEGFQGDLLFSVDTC